jgi:acyl-CoA synthetase (AMP-forming)/AMP-acid ligase II
MLLHEHLENGADKNPNFAFSEFEGNSLSYQEANLLSNQLANKLVSEGLEVGDRFAFLAKNCTEMAIMYYAASKVGAVPVPLNYRLADQEWAYIINDSEAKLIIVKGNEYSDRINQISSELKNVKKYISISLDNSIEKFQDFYDWLSDSSNEKPTLKIHENDDVYQMYTSGTTGHPKGAVLLQRNVAANIRQYLNSLTLPRPSRTLLVAPMYHAAAMINMCGCIAIGGTIVIQEDFIPQDVVDCLANEKITHTVLVPAMIQACLVSVPNVASNEYNDLDQIHYGASPIAPETLKKAMDVFKCKFGQGFGMTETVAVICLMTPEEHIRALNEKPELLKSCGRPAIDTQVEIRDENDNPLPIGEIGQICAKGPQIMKGYWNKKEESEKALKGGWMHTGDAGRMDEEGFVFIQDRIKDMIVSGGENIYSTEVEAALFAHPDVVDAAVIGVPDEKYGEVVKACIVKKEGSNVTEDDLISFCKDRIASYKKPQSVDFIDEVPRNASGKVLKKVLREPYWKDQERQVS